MKLTLLGEVSGAYWQTTSCSNTVGCWEGGVQKHQKTSRSPWNGIAKDHGTARQRKCIQRWSATEKRKTTGTTQDVTLKYHSSLLYFCIDHIKTLAWLNQMRKTNSSFKYHIRTAVFCHKYKCCSVLFFSFNWERLMKPLLRRTAEMKSRKRWSSSSDVRRKSSLMKTRCLDMQLLCSVNLPDVSHWECAFRVLES